MAITAQDVKNLREMTGCGMMDCKKALAASEGDMDKAIEWLREKGLAASAKKAGRIAAEGMAYACVVDGIGVAVEVNAETDFVGKNEKFVDFVKGVANTVAKCNPADLDALMECKYDGTDLTVSQGTTGVTENNKPVSGGASVETQPEAPQPSNPVIPPVHYHSYNTTEIKAKDDESVVVGILYTCYAGDDSYIEWNGNAVAKVGEDYYVDLNNAISAGGTVDLLKDVISPTETIVVDGKP